MAYRPRRISLPLMPVFFLATGICGGFTTFSSFMVDNYNMLARGPGMANLSLCGIELVCGVCGYSTGGIKHQVYITGPL